MTKNRLIAVCTLVAVVVMPPVVFFVYTKGMLAIREAHGDWMFFGSVSALIILAVAIGRQIDVNRRQMQNLRDGKPEWQGLE